MSEYDELAKMVAEAASSSILLLKSARPAEHISGYALCTDDSLSTLFHVATSREFCAKSPIRDVQFLAIEWPYDEGRDLFDEPYARLSALHKKARASEAFASHLESSFAALQGALLSLRKNNLVDQDVLLVVTSTDPGRWSRRRTVEAVRKLNSAELFQRWVAAQGNLGDLSEGAISAS